MAQELTGSNVKSAYDGFYNPGDDAWRMLVAKYKAYHIMDVCKSRRFNKVLEVGAGDGSITKKLSDYNFAPEFYAVETSAAGVAHIKARDINNLVSVQEFDGYKLPFDEDSFDLVILTHALVHVEHERMLLREIKRVGKNVVIDVPVDHKPDADKRMENFRAYGHTNIYTPASLRYLLQTEGFGIKKDLASIIGPEVIRFNTFVNQNKPRSFVNRVKILTTFAIKNTIVELSDTFRERLADAYTVLCTKTDKQAGILNN